MRHRGCGPATRPARLEPHVPGAAALYANGSPPASRASEPTAADPGQLHLRVPSRNLDLTDCNCTLARPAMARISLPPMTRGLLAATVFFTLLNFALRPNSGWLDKVEKPLVAVGNGVPYLTIVPGQSVVYPWVFALATVVEQNLAGLIINGATLFYAGRYLERAWGEKEFAKFILFVAVVPNILSFLLYLAGYVITSKTVPLYVLSLPCPLPH